VMGTGIPALAVRVWCRSRSPATAPKVHHYAEGNSGDGHDAFFREHWLKQCVRGREEI